MLVVSHVSPRASALMVVVALSFTALAALPVARAADDATTQARSHYEVGLRLFDARAHEQALIEFERANQLKPRPAALFMMAQCEYLLGRLKEARVHYERYASENPDGEFVELSKDRIESIDKRQSTFVINTVPDDVTVRITPEGKAAPPAAAVTGQAPNNFQVPRGRYRIDVTKPQFIGQTRVVDVDIAETKPLFFKLDPIPARLEIETAPPGATLYVNGNRARNPYRQDVVPGHYEIFAEAPNFEDRAIDFTLAPGERRTLMGANRLRLPYTQRSGRPELIFASALMGGFVGAGAVAAAIGKDLQDPNVASVLLLGGGGLAGIVAGGLIATPLVPHYIPDNRALFILGGIWMGAAEGAGVGVLWRQVARHDEPVEAPCQGVCRPSLGDQLRAGFVGSLPGLALGLTTGALFADKAPTYGRVALIQSAALGGALTGALVQVATIWKPNGDAWGYSIRTLTMAERNTDLANSAPPDRFCTDDGARCAFRNDSVLDLVPGAVIGLNIGLIGGVLGAYLPDQTHYGPSWKRVLLVDLAAGAGALAGGVAGCVAEVDDCLLDPTPRDRPRAVAAVTALIGGAAGALAGVLLTRHFDEETPATPSSVSMVGSLMPLRTAHGAVTPGLGAYGTF